MFLDLVIRVHGTYYTIEAFCDQKRIRKLRIPQEVALAALKYGPQWKFFELRGDDSLSGKGSSVREVLLDPQVIFGGVREYRPGGLCYCGVPNQRWTNGGVQCPPPPNMVFTVFVNPRDEVYLWRRERVDETESFFPIGWKTRFGEVTWKRE